MSGIGFGSRGPTRFEQVAGRLSIGWRSSYSGQLFKPSRTLSQVGVGRTTYKRKIGKSDQAKQAFQKCLVLDPINWSSYQELADLGTHPCLTQGYPANSFEYLDVPKLGNIWSSSLPRETKSTKSYAKSGPIESVPKRRAVESKVTKSIRAPLSSALPKLEEARKRGRIATMSNTIGEKVGW